MEIIWVPIWGTYRIVARKLRKRRNNHHTFFLALLQATCKMNIHHKYTLLGTYFRLNNIISHYLMFHSRLMSPFLILFYSRKYILLPRNYDKKINIIRGKNKPKKKKKVELFPNNGRFIFCKTHQFQLC